MTRRPRPRKPKQYHTQQQSSFLSLPPELRAKIYRYALISPAPIDLWPHVYHIDLTGNSEWEARTSTWSEKTTALNKLRFKTRNQTGLIYVRKEMGTGLLGTCRQVYNEAAMFFWADNIFRFTGRSGWQGLLRFFLTIGPAARARIRRLDIHAPIYMRWPEKNGEEGSGDVRDLNGYSKNFPKMHMVKITDEGHLDRVAIQRVCTILAQDRTLEEINFIIPAGFRNGDEHYYGGYIDDHDGGEDQYDRLRKISTLDFPKKTVVVEAGGYLAVSHGPRKLMDQGWDLVCLPGSAIYEPKEGQADELEKHEVNETRTWKSPMREWDYLLGLNTMFHIPEPMDIHANGGKHAKSFPILERELKGFGGCKFVVQTASARYLHETFFQAHTIRLAYTASTWAPSRQEWNYLLGVPELFRQDTSIVESPKQQKRTWKLSRVNLDTVNTPKRERGKKGTRKSRGLEDLRGDWIESGEGSTSRGAG